MRCRKTAEGHSGHEDAVRITKTEIGTLLAALAVAVLLGYFWSTGCTWAWGRYDRQVL